MERKRFSDSDADKVWINQFGYASVGKYGSNNLSNLQVLNAKDNDLKSDKYPCWNDQYGKEHCQEGS